jgi:hypothetical protein
MKKTLIALVALSGAAMAGTQVWDLSTSVTSGDYLYDATTGLFTDNAEVDGTVLNDVNGTKQIQTNICFTLNLTEAQKVTENTKLIKMDMGGDIGLCLTSTGLASTWGGTTSSSRGSVSYDTLLADSGVFTDKNGDKCITLTFVETYGSGVQVWSNTTKHINDGGLKASGNTSLSSIYVNAGYIEALQFAPGWEGDAIVNTNAAFNTAVVEKLGAVTIPEPTTATLSLLALCGLAARRRRK